MMRNERERDGLCGSCSLLLSGVNESKGRFRASLLSLQNGQSAALFTFFFFPTTPFCTTIISNNNKRNNFAKNK